MASTEDRILFLIKTGGPRTAADLAARLGVTSTAVRQHLARLLDQDLVTHEDQRGGVGRPRRHWRLTETGEQRFPDSHAHLTLDLLSAVRDEFGEAGLDRIIERRERESLGQYRAALDGLPTLERKVEALAALRDREGYMAEHRREADGTLWLIENHCPICAAAKTCQGLCRSELEIFRRVIGPDAEVERVDYILAGARRCAYRITPKQDLETTP